MIFVLGGHGFYGSAFVRVLAAQHRSFRIITRQNYREFQGQRCDLLINAAGNSSKILARRAPLEDFDASVRSVRQSLGDFRFRRYVYLSSCDVYPDCSPGALTAEDSLITASAQSPYGFHKSLAEACVRHEAAEWLIVRLGGAVGPGLKKNAIHDILQGGPLWLDPASRLQFMQTDEAARTVLRLADLKLWRETFNVAGTGTIALSEVLSAAQCDVPVHPGSPRVHYEVDLQKTGQHVAIPQTSPAVLDFVRGALSQRIQQVAA